MTVRMNMRCGQKKINRRTIKMRGVSNFGQLKAKNLTTAFSINTIADLGRHGIAVSPGSLTRIPKPCYTEALSIC